MSKLPEPLAVLGGFPHIAKPFKKYTSIGEEEKLAVLEVIESGVLSDFVGDLGPKFMGGEKVKELELKSASLFGSQFSIAVNSWTSGLICAVGSLGLKPGDEIITSSWTMAATATSIVNWNLTPVFCDIDRDTFNLDVDSVRKKITNKTKAILAPDIFGQSADIYKLQEICKEFNLRLISDTAQAPGAKYHNKFAGTISDIGGISLNHHKHITCGEGGIIFTNNEKFYEKMLLIRNHGEVVISKKKQLAEDEKILYGYNFRLGELESSIAIEQLKKIENLILSRQEIAKKLDKAFDEFKEIISIPVISTMNTHVYYIYGLTLQPKYKYLKNKIFAALNAEGVPSLLNGYQNIHKFPLFRKYVNYELPVTEDLHNHGFIGLNICSYSFDEEELDLLIGAFKKVLSNIKYL